MCSPMGDSFCSLSGVYIGLEKAELEFVGINLKE